MPLYTLLIGINNYAPTSKVPNLSGCQHDVESMQRFLQEHYPVESQDVKILLNEAATYKNIIAHFGEKHLLKAKKGDTVLVHFSGHGARGFSAPAFKKYYPDGMDENLICYDSRLVGHQDLADKELAVLIERIAKKGVKVIVILDCCHSGSGTRGAGNESLMQARRWEDRKHVRPLDTYLDGYFTKGIHLPVSKHILLAACEKREQALELSNKGGLLTTQLLHVLRGVKGKISYAKLFAQTRIQMRQVTQRQTPQFEPSGFFNVHQNFLGTAEGEERVFSVFYQDSKWQVEAGVMQGLSTIPDVKALFEIYQNGQSIAHAQSISVKLNHSSIQLDIDLDTSQIYQAKLRSLPLAPILIDLVSEDVGDLLEESIQSYQPIYFDLRKDIPFAPYRLTINTQSIQLVKTSNQKLIGEINRFDTTSLYAIFKRLEHICRWEKILVIDNKKNTNSKQLDLILYELADNRNVIKQTSASDGDVNILFEKDQKEIPFKFVAKNNSDVAWHCALLYFSEKYGIHQIYNEEIPANSEVVLMEYNSSGTAYSFALNGKKEVKDIFKLIASNKKIDTHLLTQVAIELGEMKLITKRSSSFGRKEEASHEAFEDWFTLSMYCYLQQMET